jgi:signal transduction histidine kinase
MLLKWNCKREHEGADRRGDYVNSMVNPLKASVKLIQGRIDSSSLQFRLILGSATILILGLGSLVLWMDWEIKQFLIGTQQQNISLDSNRLLAILQNLKIVSLLLISIATIINILYVQRTLFPLQQVLQAMKNQTPALSLNPIRQAPREVRQLIDHWNHRLVYISEMQEQQKQFINGAAHELRTPLSLVYGYLQQAMRRNHNLADSQKEALAMAAAEAKRMTEVLQELLLLARADRGAIPFHLESLVLNELLVELTHPFEQRTICLEADAKPIEIKADRRYLTQVLSRLIDNAVRYAPVDEPIILKLNRREGWAVIQVCDSARADLSARGGGIPLAQQAQIFEPFYRVDPSRTRSTGGFGLGLSIVKALVESMGGSVTVRSIPDQGTTFTLTLPAQGAP